jgi:hypothetical protein
MLPYSCSAPDSLLSSLDSFKAGEGNRTLVISLEGCCSTIELHPQSDFGLRIWDCGLKLNSAIRNLKSEIKMGSAGFEPAKAEPADLQSAPFGHFGNSPVCQPRPFASYLTHKRQFDLDSHELRILDQPIARSVALAYLVRKGSRHAIHWQGTIRCYPLRARSSRKHFSAKTQSLTHAMPTTFAVNMLCAKLKCQQRHTAPIIADSVIANRGQAHRDLTS